MAVPPDNDTPQEPRWFDMGMREATDVILARYFWQPGTPLPRGIAKKWKRVSQEWMEEVRQKMEDLEPLEDLRTELARKSRGEAKPHYWINHTITEEAQGIFRAPIDYTPPPGHQEEDARELQVDFVEKDRVVRSTAAAPFHWAWKASDEYLRLRRKTGLPMPYSGPVRITHPETVMNSSAAGSCNEIQAEELLVPEPTIIPDNGRCCWKLSVRAKHRIPTSELPDWWNRIDRAINYMIDNDSISKQR